MSLATPVDDHSSGNGANCRRRPRAAAARFAVLTSSRNEPCHSERSEESQASRWRAILSLGMIAIPRLTARNDRRFGTIRDSSPAGSE